MAISEYTFRLRDFHPKSCKIGSDGMCDFCSHISQLDIAIQDTQRTLEKLIDERDALLTTQASCIHSPILRLPTELTLRIFAFYVESEHDSYVEEQYNYYHHMEPIYEEQQMPDCAAPLTLSAVCQRWREIAFASPALWTTPVVQIYSGDQWQLEVQEELLTEWLDRSVDLPLEISIFRSFDPALWNVRHAFTNAVQQVAPRLASLDLNLPSDFCEDFLKLCGAFRLEELRLHPAASTEPDSLEALPQLPHLPVLRYLWSNGSMKLNIQISSELPALVVCHLSNLFVQDVLTLLRHAPNLEQGTFENLHSISRIRPGRQIIHRNLKKMNIHSGTIFWKLRWLDNLILPSFESFNSNTKVCQGDAFIDAFLSFLRRSQCRLREFILWGYSEQVPQASLLMILESTPSLTRLVLNCSELNGPTWFSDILIQRFSQCLDAAGQSTFLPHIEALEIQTRAWDLPFSWETFLVFLEILNSRYLAFPADNNGGSIIHASNRGHITVSVYLSGPPEEIENIIPSEIVNQLAAYQKGPFVVLKILHSESGRDLIEASESLSRAQKDDSVEV